MKVFPVYFPRCSICDDPSSTYQYGLFGPFVFSKLYSDIFHNFSIMLSHTNLYCLQRKWMHFLCFAHILQYIYVWYKKMYGRYLFTKLRNACISSCFSNHIILYNCIKPPCFSPSSSQLSALQERYKRRIRVSKYDMNMDKRIIVWKTPHK